MMFYVNKRDQLFTNEIHVTYATGHVYHPFILRPTQETISRQVSMEKQTEKQNG